MLLDTEVVLKGLTDMPKLFSPEVLEIIVKRQIKYVCPEKLVFW